jgi:Zn-dependent protease with chaperone function
VGEFDAARALFPSWLIWSPLLLNLSVAAAVSFLAVRLAALPTPRWAWSKTAAHWTERARAIYPSRRAIGAITIFAPVFFGMLCWMAGGELLPLSRWTMGFVGCLISFVFVHLAAFLVEQRIRPRLTIARYARAIVLHLFVVGWLLLPAVLVFVLSGENIDGRFFVACFVGLAVAIGMQRVGILRAAPRVGLAREADERLRAIMDRAAEMAGTRPDWVGILPLSQANAFADPIHRHVLFTSGALEGMNDGELEAIALHELGHLDDARSFKQARAMLIALLLLLGASRPLFAEFGLAGFLSFLALAALAIALNSRRRRRGEESADRHAHGHLGDPYDYAVALERLYEINLAPAVLGHKLATHPDLYDRQLAAGYTPLYPRPNPPSTLRNLVGIVVPVSFVFVSFLVFWVAVPRLTNDHVQSPATSAWIVQSPGGEQLFFSAWAAHYTAPEDAQTLLRAALASQDARKWAFVDHARRFTGMTPCAIARPLREALSLRFGEASTQHFEPCIEDDLAHDRPLEAAPPAALALDHRPNAGRYLFDYAGVLEHYEEAAHHFLRGMSERFHIEAVIVTLPELPTDSYIEEVAVDLVDRWRIGGKHNGRGVLLLLVAKQKQVKLEVTYELEDVFTDAFTRYVEDLQLRPYYLANDIGTGLVAVMEELEQRAQIKHQGQYTPRTVARLDDQLLSGGAGTRRNLARYETDGEAARASTNQPSQGARSPEEAWSIMLAKWGGKGASLRVDVYTEMTKLAMGDPDQPDPRTRRSVGHWANANYRIRQDGDHAVIWFGNIKGWDNAPFLFCRTPTGWKFDIVHQRRIVVMGRSPDWMIEQGSYPYVELLSDAQQSSGKDLPLPPEDRYSCDRDAKLARQLRELESARQRSADDVDTLLALARLNVITGRRPTHVHPLLARLRKLAPSNPEVHKYAAIYNVNSFFQYETALADMLTYVKLRPLDAFGHSFVGFLHYQLGDHRAAVDSLRRALEIAPNDAYANRWFARSRARLSRRAKSDSAQ